jgi:hypothetical protein
MSWRGIFRQLRHWSQTFWPEDHATRQEAKRDRLYRLLRQRFTSLVRRRQRIDGMKENIGPTDPRLMEQEADYRQRLKELEHIKRQLARFQTRNMA